MEQLCALNGSDVRVFGDKRVKQKDLADLLVMQQTTLDMFEQSRTICSSYTYSLDVYPKKWSFLRFCGILLLSLFPTAQADSTSLAKIPRTIW